MTQFLRRIAPAVFVGTAAVVVVSTAGGGADAASASGALADPAPGNGALADPAPGNGALADPAPGGTPPAAPGTGVPADPAPGNGGQSVPQAGDSDDMEALVRQFFGGQFPNGDDDDDDAGYEPVPPATPQSGSTGGSTGAGAGTTAGGAGAGTAAGGAGAGTATGGAGTGTTTNGAGTGACDSAEVAGPVVRTEWGPVQVAARVSNGRVCAVRTIMTPDGDRKSVMINARAVPRLEQNVVAAGDASFDGVSGATVTSEGYRQSLQSILDGA